jgi:hypothetical protein
MAAFCWPVGALPLFPPPVSVGTYGKKDIHEHY